MAWQQPGFGGGNMGGGGLGDGQQSNQPQGTEYTLQGVMRFLQTEWHRHERDRNAWEIERQEMKARIAALEGQGRRADTQQRSLRKYVKMLEQTIENERKKKANGVTEPVKLEKEAPSLEALKAELKTSENEIPFEKMEPDRSNLKTYLDQCSGEFTYLMVSPSNPQPPREPPPSPPNPEDVALAQSYEIPPGQPTLEEFYQQQGRSKAAAAANIQRQAPVANHHPQSIPPMSHPRNPDAVTAPMVRSLAEQPAAPGSQSDWSASFQLADQAADENVIKINHSYNSYGRPVENEVQAVKPPAPDVGAWDFSDAALPESEMKSTTSRPDTDVFPTAQEIPKSPSRGPASHRRKGSMSRRKSADNELSLNAKQAESGAFKVRFGFRGHLDTVRSVIFTGGGSPGEPELCTAGDDGTIKRWIIPARYETHGGVHNSDLDVQSYFTHRGHTGSVMCLTAYSQNFASGGRAQGDGWVFSGGQDSSVRVWERGRVDPKATLEGHTDAVWALCVLPATCGSVFGANNSYGGSDRLLLVSGAADGTVRVWSVSMPPQLTSPPIGSGRRGGGGRVRGNSMSSGSAFPSSPQPSIASNSPFHYTLIHTIQRENSTASPTCITPLSTTGETFVVSYTDAAVLVYDTRTGEEIVSMLSQETYDGTSTTGVNAVVASTTGLEGSLTDAIRGREGEEGIVHGATGTSAGTEGVIISGHEDRYIRFYDANSGQCTYNMLAHPAAISALSMSPDGRELVSAGHDASLRFWSLDKRSCTQEITSHRLMRGEGVCSVVWSQDGRWVVSAGGDGVVKVFAR